jgi:YD repeat-containing protein
MKKYAAILILLLFCTFHAINVSAASYEYDQLNRLTSVSYDDGSSVSYTYDSAGNILSVEYLSGQQAARPTLTKVSYFANKSFSVFVSEVWANLLGIVSVLLIFIFFAYRLKPAFAQRKTDCN